MKKRVVITGMGVLSPIGNNLETYWESLSSGKNGIGPITCFDIDDRYASRIAGELKDFDITQYMSPKEARKMDPFTQYGLVASIEAVKDSGLNIDNEDPNRIGVILSSGIGGLQTLGREFRTLYEKGPRRVSPFFIPMIITDILPGHVSIHFGFKGPNYATVSACASSSHAIGEGLRAIQKGEADIMVVGGAEATITDMGIASFSSLKALSTRNDDPEHASRPFDNERDGFVMGEGAGIIVIEELEHALARNARIYTELAGYACTGDAYHITAPSPDGEGAVRAMKQAIEDAGLELDDVDYINAHGTSTPHNDRTETFAIKTLFGEKAYDLAINSTKSMIGHLLGASGGVEIIASSLCILNQTIHPTVNQIVPDPDCDLNYVPNVKQEKVIDVAISNSFGFGGHNVCLVIKKYQ